jgi:hypothetical protein
MCITNDKLNTTGGSKKYSSYPKKVCVVWRSLVVKNASLPESDFVTGLSQADGTARIGQVDPQANHPLTGLTVRVQTGVAAEEILLSLVSARPTQARGNRAIHCAGVVVSRLSFRYGDNTRKRGTVVSVNTVQRDSIPGNTKQNAQHRLFEETETPGHSVDDTPEVVAAIVRSTCRANPRVWDCHHNHPRERTAERVYRPGRSENTACTSQLLPRRLPQDYVGV